MLFSKIREMIKNPIIISLMCSSVLVGCKDTLSPTPTSTQTLTKLEFASIGENHNKGLDFILEYIKASKGEGKMTTSQILKLNKMASFEYISNTYPSIKGKDLLTIKEKMESLNAAFTGKISGRVQDDTQDLLDQLAPYMSSNQSSCE